MPVQFPEHGLQTATCSALLNNRCGNKMAQKIYCAGSDKGRKYFVSFSFSNLINSLKYLVCCSKMVLI